MPYWEDIYAAFKDETNVFDTKLKTAADIEKFIYEINEKELREGVIEALIVRLHEHERMKHKMSR